MPRTKNPCGKTVKPENAYAIWQIANHPIYGGQWSWFVLKKYQSPEKEAQNPYARWLCFVTSPYVPRGEYGDTYVSAIIETGATQLIQNLQAQLMRFHVHAEKSGQDGVTECIELWPDRLASALTTYYQCRDEYPLAELLIEMTKDGEEEEGVWVTLLSHKTQQTQLDIRDQHVQTTEKEQ